MPVEFIGELIIEKPFLNKISMPISKPLTKCTRKNSVPFCGVMFFPFGRENVDALG